MKQILILAATYEPFKDGVAEAARVMACGLAERGYQVIVGTGYHPDRGPDPAGANPSVRQFKVYGSSSLRQGFSGEVSAYQKFVAGFRGDFIICHCWQIWTTDLAIPVFASTPAKKILASQGFDAHRVGWHREFPWGLGQWLGWLPYVMRLPFLLRRFSRLVFVSSQVDLHRFLDQWVAKRTGYTGIAVIPNCADPDKFNQHLADFRSELGIGPGCMFLCVANYCTRKNQELAVRAFRKARLRGATLVFIGSEFNEYQTMVRELDLEMARSYPEGRVVFLEHISREMTFAAYKACDVVVLSAKEETQPFVLIEAMAAGKPFISTRSSGCISELRGGVVVYSEQEISEQMKHLGEHPEARSALGQAGQKDCLARYTCERVVDAYDELLQSLTEKGSSVPTSETAAV